MTNQNPTLEEIVSLCKRRGFVYPTSEIYGGLANSYDYGPLGSQLLVNLRNLWWREFINKRPDMVGLDSQIIQHPQTWVASGHVASFSDPLVEDLKTHKRFRADHLIEAWLQATADTTNLIAPVLKDATKKVTDEKIKNVEDLTPDQMGQFIKENNIKSPEGNDLSEVKTFNLLFETAIGSVAGEKSKVYLRGETAQGIFANFKQILDSTRVQIPFGVGQIGKSFRNEVTTGQFVFRTLEFEQAEIEYFFDPEQTDWQELMRKWKDAMWQFATQTLGIRAEKLRWRKHTDTERSHYSKDTYDLEYLFPFGWKELWGIAYRTDYDLKQHIQHSGANLEYTDPHSGNKVVPHVIEPAVGINRLFLMILVDAFWKDEEKNRTLLRLKPELAPYQYAVFPLLKNKPELVAKAREIFNQLLDKGIRVTWDDRGNIGKRYLYQDEIGTPACITVDFQTLEDDTVTVRDRDTGEQQRVKVDSLANL